MSASNTPGATQPVNGRLSADHAGCHTPGLHSTTPQHQTESVSTAGGLRYSGRYNTVPTVGLPNVPFTFGTLTLDVDGDVAQMMVGGTAGRRTPPDPSVERVYWIARLTRTGGFNKWEGDIWYREGTDAVLPYDHVQITAYVGLQPAQFTLDVVFSRGTAMHTVEYEKVSSYFHPVEIELDSTPDATVVTTLATHDHPRRPADLTNETLTLQTVFQRAGFDAIVTQNVGVVPTDGAGLDNVWSDLELHDAMQTYWSRFNNAPQWAVWGFFTPLHEDGVALGGIMFDTQDFGDLTAVHRQGCAIFTDSFIANPEPGESNPDAAVRRLRFWTAVHELGHAFNLVHSVEKHLGIPWLSGLHEPEARSFMNYPYAVSGGSQAFFGDFRYQFSPSELQFLRHAPEHFVQQGASDWGIQHGILAPERNLRLELRVTRPDPTFEFLESVMVELKLTNNSTQPVIVPEWILRDLRAISFRIQRDKGAAQIWSPYNTKCWANQAKVLQPGESLYEPHFIAAGRGGWTIADPGYYTLQAALYLGERLLMSNPLRIRVTPPLSYDEEYLAQDFFSDGVGRALAFDGSKVLESGNATLHEVANRLADRKVAIHAKVALGCAAACRYKELAIPETEAVFTSAENAGATIRVHTPDVETARMELNEALLQQPNRSAESLSHMDYHYYVDKFSAWLAEHGDPAAAVTAQQILHDTLAQRGVLPQVLNKIQADAQTYQTTPVKPTRSTTTTKTASPSSVATRTESRRNRFTTP